MRHVLWLAAFVAVVSGAVWAGARAWNRPVETAGQSFIEKFNQGVRAICLLALTTMFCWGFYAKQISGEVFTAIFSGVLGYWFASREAKARSQADQPPTTTTTTADTKVVTAPTPAAG